MEVVLVVAEVPPPLHLKACVPSENYPCKTQQLDLPILPQKWRLVVEKIAISNVFFIVIRAAYNCCCTDTQCTRTPPVRQLLVRCPCRSPFNTGAEPHVSL